MYQWLKFSRIAIEMRFTSKQLTFFWIHSIPFPFLLFIIFFDLPLFFRVLISTLGKSVVKSRELRELDASLTKFTELIMKCLWKLSKTIQENLKSGSLEPSILLLDIHHFMNSYGPADRKNRTENSPLGEVPFKTIKTILYELIMGLGENIYEHLGLIDYPQKSNLLPCLIHMLEAYKKKQPNLTAQPTTSSVIIVS